MNDLGPKLRPWGLYTTIAHENDHFVRYLAFDPNGELSVSKHEFRDEHWVILKGCALITVDNVECVLFAGEDITIKRGQVHHIINPSNDEVLEILETAWGEKACDSDIIRISDKYGR